MVSGRFDRRGGVAVAVLAVVLAAAMVLCSMVGVVQFSWEELWRSPIFLNLRAPRVVLAVLVGAALSVCGAVYQSVFRNGLTDPYVLGVSSGASLGAAVAIVLGLEAYRVGVGGCALLTGLLTVVAIYRIASTGNRMHTTTLLLTGVCITFLMSAVISFLMVLRQDKMDSIIFWTMGSFASASWTDVAVVAPVVAGGMLLVLYYCRDLNLLLAGSETAQSLGVEVERVKRVLLVATTLMVAFCVAACGALCHLYGGLVHVGVRHVGSHRAHAFRAACGQPDGSGRRPAVHLPLVQK